MGFEMLIAGYKQHQEDLLYMKWVNSYTELSFNEFKKEVLGTDGYRKSTEKEKALILKRFLKDSDK